MALKGLLRTLEDGGLAFWCLGCGEMHAVSKAWQFNGNFDAPTITPSVLVRGGHYAGPGECWCTYNTREIAEGREPSRFKCEQCHLHLIDGWIQYLGDCTHRLAGQRVKLEVPPV